MAYISQLPEQEKNQFGRTDQTTPTPLPPQAGGSAGASAKGMGGAAPGMATSTQFGSNAAKLSDYLKANEPQVAEFGRQVAGNLTQGYNQARGAIDTGFGNFGQAITQGYAQPNQEKIAQATANPSEFVKNPENVSQFQSWYNNQYSGPENIQSWEPYTGINNQVNQAVENASLVGNQAGLGTYLENFMGNKNASPGMKALDTALLQRSPEAAQTIQAAAAPYQGLSSYLGGKAEEANKNVAATKEQVAQGKQALQKQFTGQGGVIPTFQQNIQQGVTKAQQEATQRANDVQNLISMLSNPTQNTQTLFDYFIKNQLPQNVYSDLGLDKNQLLALKALQTEYAPYVGTNDLMPYLTQQTAEAQIRPENFATSQDYANAQALSQLTGQDLSGFLNPTNISQAGTANLDLSDFNYQNAYNNQIDKINQYISQHYPGETGYLKPHI